MKTKQILAWILTLAMVMTFMPVLSYAIAVETPEGPVVLTKTLVVTEDGMPNELKLEAYVTGSLEKTDGSAPADIVLVLDQSGSMDDNITSNNVTKSKLEIMKEAVTSFTAKVAELNTNGDGSDYRVAVVGFGSANTNTEILTTTPVRTYTWLGDNAQYEYEEVDSNTLDEDQTYYIVDGSTYEEIKYHEYSLFNDGWYTGNGIWGGDYVNVSETTVYERYEYPSTEYANAFVNCTSAAVAERGAITNAINALDGNGATRTDLGMEMASYIFATQPAGTYAERKRIVVLLTDGVPTTSSSFSETVANNAIGYAKGMKDGGAEVFALYFGNPEENSRNFMQGVSSNYPDATAYDNLGTQAKTTYYSAHNNASAITDVFNEIVYSIAADIQLDEEAILQDELTEYFKLPDTVAGDLPDEIRVYTSDKTATGWAEEVLFEDAVVEISQDNKTISVSGFDYAYYCVTQESKSQTTEDYGKKLIVYIPIIADETSDTIGGYLPTNVHAGVYEDDVAVEYDDAEVTAEGYLDDVGLAYMMENAEFFRHIGTDDSFEFVFNAENMAAALDEMFLTKPDGENNIGVRLDYRIYDTNTDQSTGTDDTLVATLALEPGDDTDITDITNWDFVSGMDTATLTIPDDENSASKIYAIVCRAYNINPEYEENPVYHMTYGLLNVTIVNNDVHIVGGVIDDGGTVTVPDGSAGRLTYDMENNPIGYTEEIEEFNDSAEMTFTLKEGYIFRRILEKTSVDSELDTTRVLYDIDEGIYDGNTFEYQVIGVTGGQIVEVYTQLKKFTLTTESGENSLIMDGRDYEYNATEKLNVPFSAKEGYEITSVRYGETEATAVEILGMSAQELEDLGITLKDVVTASGYAADGTPEIDLIQGEVQVPRTQDNYVAVTASPRIYKLTYMQYQRVVNNLETTYELYGTDAVHYVMYNTALPAAPVEPGTETEINGENYTVSDWYRYHPNNEFTGLTNVSTTLMPAVEMTLHAYWTKNPSIEVSIPVKKIIAGSADGQNSFKIVGTYHEHPVGDVTLNVLSPSTEAEGTLTLTLTDKQNDSFMQGDVIRITESDETGDNWIYDTTEYTVHYNASGDPIIKKDEEVVTSADFTNYYNGYMVKYNLDGGTYQGVDSIQAKTVKYNDAALIPNDALVKNGFEFIGWKYGDTAVSFRTTYEQLAGSKDVFEITLVAQYQRLTTPVQPGGVLYITEHYKANANGVYPTTPTDTVMKSGEIGAPVTAEPKIYDGYCVNEQVSELTKSGTLKAITSPADIVTLKLYYDIDIIGENVPDEGDDIPDIYQKKITFKILNGKWEDGTTEDIEVVVSLLDEGKYSENGTADISTLIPTGMIADPDHDTPGEWRDGNPATTVSGTEPVVYTFIFHKTPDVIYDEFIEDEPEPTPTSEEYVVAEKIQVDPNGGIWNYNGENYTDVQTIEMQENIDLGTPTREGYVFMGWLQTEGEGEIVHIYTAQWEKDEIGTTEPDDGDEVADIFQKKITFKVVNGTWADDTTADIIIVVNLLDENRKHSKTGEADIEALIPIGMKANYGYRNGKWDTVPETPARGEAAVTYTYSFEKTPGGGGGGGGVTRYTLTYDTNGGSAIAKETYNSGATVKLTKVPKKEGYVFEGWYEDKELTKPVDEVKMIKNITVYAAWVEDNGNAGNGHDTPGSLNGEDHFAYVVGYPDGTVRPNANIDRAEVTTIFFRLLKEEIRNANLADTNSFKDVSDEDWHNTAISTMTKLGIVKGRYTDRFVPDAAITRAEFAVICARFDDSEFEVVDEFTDVQGHWAEVEIHEAAAHGWIRGYEDGTFKPDQFITRAEAMTMINRVLNRVPETAADLLADMIKWSDNSDESAWYYLPVQEATNSHDYDMKNHIYEKWTDLREVTDWTQYQ